MICCLIYITLFISVTFSQWVGIAVGVLCGIVVLYCVSKYLWYSNKCKAVGSEMRSDVGSEVSVRRGEQQLNTIPRHDNSSRTITGPSQTDLSIPNRQEIEMYPPTAPPSTNNVQVPETPPPSYEQSLFQ